MKTIGIVAALSIFLVIGIGIFSLGARNLRYAWASGSWPSVPGTVSESTVKETAVRHRDSSSSDTDYSARIVFGYQVNGIRYTTTTLHFGQTEGSSDSSEAALRRFRYPEGAKVIVYYDPNNPEHACIEKGFDSDVLWLPAAGLAFFLPGVMAIVLFLSAEKKMPGFAFGIILFCSIFMLIGGVMLWGGGRSLWRARQSPNWPVVPGTIVYGHWDESTSSSNDDDDEVERSTSYGMHLVFRYEVNGVKYFSNIRRFGQLDASSEEWAGEIARRYPTGAAVRVAYHPQDPALAVLEPGISNEAWWLPGAGAAFFLFGLAACIWGVPALTRDPF
jgi:hypothetical protein